MMEFLKSKELVYPDADEQQIGGFLAKQISANKGYDFYALLRRESEARRSKKKKKNKSTSQKKNETKSKKKTTKKRKSKK
jgi:hypothetical protein